MKFAFNFRILALYTRVLHRTPDNLYGTEKNLGFYPLDCLRCIKFSDMQGNGSRLLQRRVREIRKSDPAVWTVRTRCISKL